MNRILSSRKLSQAIFSATCLSLILSNAAFAGEPYEDYMAFRKVLEKMRSSQDLKPFTLDKEQSKLDAPTPLKLAELKLPLDFINPVKVSEKIDGDTAKLVMDGTQSSHYTTLFTDLINKEYHSTGAKPYPVNGLKRRLTIEMQLEDGTWKIAKVLSGADVLPPANASNNAVRSVYKEPFVSKPVSGSIGGKPIVFNDFSYATMTNTLSLNSKRSDGFLILTFDVRLNDIVDSPFTKESVYKDDHAYMPPTISIQAVDATSMSKNKLTYYNAVNGEGPWGLRLRLMPPKNKLIAGYINWKADNATKDHVEGFFYAKFIEKYSNQK